jgi:hypothetical protein
VRVRVWGNWSNDEKWLEVGRRRKKGTELEGGKGKKK